MLLKRTVLNPVLVLSGILTLVTGLFLFFKVKSLLIVVTHEYGSVVFAVACLLHLALNWKPLLHSVKGCLPSWAMVAVLVVVTCGMAYSGMTADPAQGKGQRHGGKRHSAVQESALPQVRTDQF